MKVVYLEDGEGNTTGNTGNANNANGNGSFKSIIDGIIKMIDDFFNKSKTMLGDLMKKQTNYGTWIHDEKVRDGILNRNYSPVVFNVLPYEKHVTTDAMLNDIASLQANITGLNAGNIRKYNTKKNLNGYLFKFMTNNLGSVEDIGETMKSYYKTKEAKLEVMSYSGAQAKDLAKTMIDYSSLFYGENGNGFSSQLMDKLDAVNKALNSKLQELETMNVNESVLYEADENTGTTQTNAQPASGTNTQSSGTNNTTNSGTGDKKSTKATVQIDKATDSNVSEDGKKSETDTIISILKWLSSSVQTYCAGTLNAARDRNWDYIKILDGVAPEQVKFKKWCADNNLGDQNTNNQNAQNNQNNTQNTEQNNQNNNNQQAS
jgi:hypothetical protein